MSEEQQQLERGRFEGAVMARLDSIDAKLDAMAKQNSALDKKLSEEDAKLLARIEVLERWKAMLMGGALVVGAVSGAISSKVVSLFVK